MTNDLAVETESLVVRRGKNEVLHGIDLHIPEGQLIGLLGPSGSGKTTLMRAILGSQQTASGTITVLGQPAGSRVLRRQIGYMAQTAEHLRRPHRAAEPRLLRRRAQGAARRRRPGARSGRPDLDREAARGQPQRRAAHAGVAGDRPARHSSAAHPRRADGRPRPRASSRPVAAVPAADRHGREPHRLEPRHGRGPTLRLGSCCCATAG